MLQRVDPTAVPSIRAMPAGLFWSRECDLTIEVVRQQQAALLAWPVPGTEYLLRDGEDFLTAVPYRHCN